MTKGFVICTAQYLEQTEVYCPLVRPKVSESWSHVQCLSKY
jgi:hypothetical protein